MATYKATKSKMSLQEGPTYRDVNKIRYGKKPGTSRDALGELGKTLGQAGEFFGRLFPKGSPSRKVDAAPANAAPAKRAPMRPKMKSPMAGARKVGGPRAVNAKRAMKAAAMTKTVKARRAAPTRQTTRRKRSAS
jgi:hypothetical protein